MKKALTVNLVISYSSSVVGFLCVLIMARALGADEYAWIAMGLAIGNVLSTMVGLGSQRVFVRDAVEKNKPVEVATLAANSFVTRLSAFFVCLVIIALFSLANTESVFAFLGLLFTSAWVLSRGLYPESWYDYTHTTKTQNIFIFIERLFSLIVCVVLIFLPAGMQIAMIVAIPLFVIRAMVIRKQVCYWLKETGEDITFNPQFLKPSKKPEGLSYFVAAAMFSNAILTYGNQVVLGMNETKYQLPSYSIAFQIISIVMIFQGQALRLFLREIAESCNMQANVKRNFFKHCLFVASISFVMAVLAWVASIHILPFFLTADEFSQIPEYVFVLGIWIIIIGIGKVVSQYILAFNLDTYYLKVSVIGGSLAFILGVVFIPTYGAYAVAFILISTHMTMICANLLRLFVYLDEHDIK